MTPRFSHDRSVRTLSARRRPLSSAQIREENCKHLFHLIRQHQPVSRSDLSRLTGMAKATVFPIVKQIIQAGWLEEGKAIKIPRGRSPIMLRPSRRMLVYAVALQERTAVLGLVNLEGHVLEQHSIVLPRDERLAAQAIASELQNLMKSRAAKVMCIGVCIASFNRGRVRTSSEAVRAGRKVAENLGALLEVPVEVGTVLEGTLVREMSLHNLRKIRSVVLLQIADEVVGTIWANGEFLSDDVRNLGHFCIDPQGRKCACGRSGCLSLYASNNAALAAFHSISGSARSRKIEEVYQLFTDGDAAAVEAVKTQAEGIAAGISILSRILDPDLFVVQGKCARIWQHLSAQMRRELETAGSTLKAVHLTAVESGELDWLTAAGALGWLGIDFGTPGVDIPDKDLSLRP